MKNNLDLLISNNINMTKKAYEYCCKVFSHEELIQELESDDEIKKQLCIINLNKLDSIDDADALVDNLTNKGGPIREVTSVKINELINQPIYQSFFQSSQTIDTFIKAITDVNPTVSRNIIECLTKIENKEYLKQKLIEKTFQTIDEIKEFREIKSHLLNKKTFNLYWCLESIIHVLPYVDINQELEDILALTASFNDYTIREKTAKILSNMNSNNMKIDEIIKKLKIDENMYVRRYFSQL